MIGSLSDLLELLHIQADPLVADPAPPPPVDGHSVPGGVVVLAHSTALSGHVVSPINPRAIVMGGRTIIAFQRGVQRIELATLANGKGTFNFYLLSFEQACNGNEDGCSPGDLYTPRIEADWTRVDIHDDEDLKNSPLDCRQCHQRGREAPILLMREVLAPWTHFFGTLSDNGLPGSRPDVRGGDLLRDYLQAKGDEPYGQVSMATISRTSGFLLQAIIGPQPLVFDAPTIENERFPYEDDGTRAAEPQPSATWNGAFEAFKRGEQLALPYVEPRATDPRKQAELSDAYARYRADEISADELPDMADIFPDDPLVRAQIGLQTEPDATPGDALVQACGPCHNDVLDQTVTRARFSIDLTRLEPAQIERAIARIELPSGAPGAMPPPEARQLDPEARERLLQYLRAEQRVSDYDAQLKRAAELGMLTIEP